MVTSSDEFSLARKECLLPPSKYSILPAVNSRSTSPTRNATVPLQALNRNFSRHLVRRQFVACRKHDPNHFEIIRFDDRLRDCLR